MKKGILYAVLVINCLQAINASAQQKPNIILILTDDLGYGDVGIFYKNQRKPSGTAACLMN